MNDQTLGILGGVSIALLVGTYFVSTAEKTVELPFESGQRLLEQGVDVDKIVRIELEKGEAKLTLQRENGQFRIAQKSEYPARQITVDQLIRSVDEIVCASRVTEDEDAYDELQGELEVDGTTYPADISGSNPICTQIRFLNAEGNEMAKVWVTDAVEIEGEANPVQYCRVEGDKNVYRLDDADRRRRFAAQLDPMRYIDGVVLRTRSTEIASIDVMPREGGPYSMRFDVPEGKSPKPVLVDVPEGYRQLTPEVRTAMGATNSLRFEDVKPASDLGADFEFKFSHNVRFLDDRLTRVEIGLDAQGRYWARTSAEFVGTLPTQPSQGAPQAELDAYRQTFEEVRRLRSDAMQYTNTHRGWAYQLVEIVGLRATQPAAALTEEGGPLPSEITASHILIKWKPEGGGPENVQRTKDEARVLAERLLVQILEEPSLFEELAREHSDDSSAPQGGSLGDPFPYEKMVKQFSEAAFNLEVGKITEEIVESGYGFHIIRRDS